MTTTTIATYVGNGSQTDFAFSFDYLRKEFVVVLVDGVAATYTFHTTQTVRVTPAPAVGKVVIVRRITDRDRLVQFVDGSILIANDLNVAALQSLHIASEALDQASGGLLIDETGAYSAGFRKLGQLGDPTLARDAVNKQWAESGMNSQLVLATTEKTEAVAAKVAAEAAKAAAIASQGAAATSAAAALADRNLAQTAKTGADTAKTGADTAKAGADTAKTAAEAARDLALGYRNTTQTYRDEVTNASSAFLIPSGGIILWSGAQAAIPAGWTLCDGTLGTPNLRDRFVVGAGSTYAVGATGGAASVTLTQNETPAHTHTISGTTGGHSNDHSHGFQPLVKLGAGGGLNGEALSGGPVQIGSGFAGALPPSNTGGVSSNHTHTFGGTTSSIGSGAAHENRPPYYALCYIMKT